MDYREILIQSLLLNFKTRDLPNIISKYIFDERVKIFYNKYRSTLDCLGSFYKTMASLNTNSNIPLNEFVKRYNFIEFNFTHFEYSFYNYGFQLDEFDYIENNNFSYLKFANIYNLWFNKFILHSKNAENHFYNFLKEQEEKKQEYEKYLQIKELERYEEIKNRKIAEEETWELFMKMFSS